jgi:hypothetical protein
MTIDEITDHLAGLDGILILQPAEGDGTPQIAWGDVFFYYSPSGVVPQATQPFATIVTKDYPDDTDCRLDRPDVFRVNIHAGRAGLAQVTAETAPDTLDAVIVHPVYASAGWVAVLNPGPRTTDSTRELLRISYDAARDRFHRHRRSSAG